MTIRLDAPPPAGSASRRRRLRWRAAAGVGDADELTQVFQNLIDNAIKYGRPGTPRVAWLAAAAPMPAPTATAAHARPRRGRRRGHATTARASPREHLPRLTERFYRVDTARSRELGGTGLGLAIVKHILNRHRGALEIDSKPGKGSSFTVYLPLARGLGMRRGV